MRKATQSRETAPAPRSASDDADDQLLRRLILDQPGNLVRRLHQISVSIFLTQAREYDLTQVQYASLLAISIYTGMDQNQLGRVVALDRTTISNVIGRLIEKGLVQRKKKDGRASALFLTGSARALIEIMMTRMDAVGETLLQPLSSSERQVFLALLKRLVDSNNALSRAPQETR